MTNREAMQMALDALENADYIIDMADAHYAIEPDDREKLITALRQALAQGEQGCAECGVKASDGYALYCVKCTDLFTRPAQEPTVPDNMQNWAKLDGVTAWHLMERHADNWADVGKMMNEFIEAKIKTAQPEQEPVARFHVEHRTNACSEVCDIDRKVYATCAWSEGAGKRAQHICDLLNADLAKHKEQA